MQDNLSIRLMRASDNLQVAKIIQTVMPEFDCVGPGYSIEDPEVKDMYTAYSAENACFYVIVNKDDEPVGCGGVAPLAGGNEAVCELKKMYFLPAARGLGMGRKLMNILIDEAKQKGFKQVYLETVERMTSANALYNKMGFRLLENQQGCTGHSGCDSFYILDLK